LRSTVGAHAGRRRLRGSAAPFPPVAFGRPRQDVSVGTNCPWVTCERSVFPRQGYFRGSQTFSLALLSLLFFPSSSSLSHIYAQTNGIYSVTGPNSPENPTSRNVRQKKRNKKAIAMFYSLLLGKRRSLCGTTEEHDAETNC